MKCPFIILASSSPRRRAFLKRLKIPFRAAAPGVEEQPRAQETPTNFARRAAMDKAQGVAARLRRSPVVRGTESPWIVIAADTVVALGRRILGKPKDAADARRMLRILSGQRHQVISGLCVMSSKKSVRFAVNTEVEFKKLTREEIEFYVASGEPMDKAGAYAIQGIGGFLIRSIRGSYTNVVGLPLAELLDILKKDFGVWPIRAPAPLHDASP